MPAKKQPAPAPLPLKWYVLMVDEGREDRVRKALLRAAKIADLFPKLFKGGMVPVTKETVPRQGDGKPVLVKTVKYPGYLFVQMAYCDETVELIRATKDQFGLLPVRPAQPQMPKNKEPSDAQQAEFDRWANWKPVAVDTREAAMLLLEQCRVSKIKPPPPPKFRAGDEVVIIDPKSPWKKYGGKLTVRADDSLSVGVLILGIETPVAVEYWQIQLAGGDR